MDDIFKRILDALQGADFCIALLFLAAGTICWRLIGTKRREQKVLRSQIGVAVVLALFAAAAILVNHFFFQRERVFSKNLTGILVMRMVDDDAHNSLQGELVNKLNVELQNDPVGKQIEVQAAKRSMRTMVSPSRTSALRAIGQSLDAKLVIWGRKIGDKKFYPRITVVNAPQAWSLTGERTRDAQKIDELRLPEEVADEPFYLIHIAAGYSYCDQGNYEKALPHFEAALRRHGGSPNEIADLQFITGDCDNRLSNRVSDPNDFAASFAKSSAKSREAIGHYEKAAGAYRESEKCEGVSRVSVESLHRERISTQAQLNGMGSR